MMSVAVLTCPAREGATGCAALLRELGAAAVAVPEEDAWATGRMVWRVRVPTARARQVKSLLREITRP